MISRLEEDRSRRFFPRCPVIDGKRESTSDREFLEMENLRLKLDKAFMESEGVLALQKIARVRQKKKKAQEFFRQKKAEKMMKELGRPPFCELIDGKYVFHPLKIPPFDGPSKTRRFKSIEEFQEEKQKKGDSEWWEEGNIPWTTEEEYLEREWIGTGGGLDEP